MCLFVSTFVCAQTSDINHIVVKTKAGTPIDLELVNNLNIETVQVGNLIQAKVHSRVAVNGRTVIEKDVLTIGRIIDVYPATANSSGSAKIEIRDVQAVDGQMVNLNSVILLSLDCRSKRTCIIPEGFVTTVRMAPKGCTFYID